MAYIWLGATGLIPAAWLIWRRKDGGLLALYFLAGSTILTADLVALGIFELYEYRPRLLAHPISEQALGVVCAEVAAVSGVVVVLAVLAPTWRGVLAGVLGVVGLEVLFRRQGLFVSHGWQLWHTAAGFAMYLGGLLWLWRSGRYRLLVTVGIAGWWWHNVSMVVTWAVPVLLMAPRVLPKFYPNQVLVAALTSGPVAIAAMVWVMASPSLGRWLVASAGLLLTDLFWMATGLWAFQAPYSLPWHFALQLGMVGAAVLTQTWISRWAVKVPARGGAGS